MNFRRIFYTVSTVVLIGCQQDSIAVFDHQAQYDIDKVLIDEYLETHSYDATNDVFKDLEDGEIALKSDDNLINYKDTVNEVAYDMYSYVTVTGTQENPDSNDIVNIAYQLTTLDDESSVIEESNTNDGFISLSNTIEGWQVGMAAFKGGEVDETDPTTPRQFFNSGKGFLIIPSGLAYRNLGSGGVAPNKNLIFKITLRTVTQVD
ncbi:FKBP-type peptidyl-prolyl cis-trans isomerase [Wenyingzhuangia sp. 2_MG-2023]|uniref:FKBP-type peptidyl-prolyl cis-trans isomerase n=1 Tax=Wenyingzhuangia sp. 2_MG-2023 TaxID=3062639 RepID=UPI0026E17BFC|nr:FKBP-type peptidyl-prolyl cis-trans isomerase [Wenyingzhuangia sp. 2_MG-2023]MDO6737759.1 hypothetical protein [Wenyingzhuangia sp. 2_MG-2023]